MRLNRTSIAGQSHIDKRFALQKLIEDARQVALVIVPTQTKLLRHSGRRAS